MLGLVISTKQQFSKFSPLSCRVQIKTDVDLITCTAPPSRLFLGTYIESIPWQTMDLTWSKPPSARSVCPGLPHSITDLLLCARAGVLGVYVIGDNSLWLLGMVYGTTCTLFS